MSGDPYGRGGIVQDCEVCRFPIARCRDCEPGTCFGWYHTELPPTGPFDGHLATPSRTIKERETA